MNTSTTYLIIPHRIRRETMDRCFGTKIPQICVLYMTSRCQFFLFLLTSFPKLVRLSSRTSNILQYICSKMDDHALLRALNN